MLPDVTRDAVEEFTVDELAARTGTTVRMLRFYRERGLLPPPQRRGRVAYYGANHRMCVDLVRQLQDHGYTLSAISQVMANLPEDASATDFAVRASLLAPWHVAESEEVDRAGLEHRAGRSLTDADIEVLSRVGAVESLDGGRFRVESTVLGSAVDVLAMELPVDLMIGAAESVQAHASALAGELIADVMEYLATTADPAADVDRLGVLLPRIRSLVMQALIRRFSAAVDATLLATIDSVSKAGPASE